MAIDTIILTHNPTHLFLKTMDALTGQTLKPKKIIIINTEAEHFEKLIPESIFLKKYDTAVIYHINKNDFDHGKTRNTAANYSEADYFVMMTQDAVPADRFLLENLLNALKTSDKTAIAYARQLATDESDDLERFIRNYNYNDISVNKSKKDINKLGIKTYFCSNVCAIYNKEIFKKTGGFTNKAIFNEDMIYAAKVMEYGYEVRYESKALVYHSHNYSYHEQLKRNFDLGVSHAEYPEVFLSLTAETEGLRMIMAAALYLLKKRKPHKIIKLIFQSLAKYRGFRLGLNYKKLKQEKIIKYTNNPAYWL